MKEEEKLYEDLKVEIKDLKTALLVGAYFSTGDKELCVEHLEELESLCTTYGFEVLGKECCPLKKIDPKAYLGKGKIEELSEKAASLEADVVIFDDEISPNQQRNLEKVFKRPVIDRTELILEVFAQHAKTKEAHLQIELAKIRYQMPRLKRLWTHLSRQTSGGAGFTKGAGESQIELDRRMLRKRMSQLNKEIEQVKKHRAVQRHARERAGVPSFAIIGYTNAGKSTLLNTLTQAGVLVEDKLFATLDTTTRKFSLPNHQQILLVDTVGFIRKIPHTIVAAFRSTLEESAYTDILLHLIDVNHPLAEEHAETTYQVLKELKVEGQPIITVLNKIDICENKLRVKKLKLKYHHTVEISALNREGIDELLDLMMEELSKLRKTVSLRIPQSHYALVSELMHEGRVIHHDYEGNDILLTIEIPQNLEHKIKQFEVGA